MKMIIKLLISLIMLLKVMTQNIRWKDGADDQAYWQEQLQLLELEARSIKFRDIDTT